MNELETKFIGKLVSDRIHVSIYLMNGIQLQGKIEAHDDICVLVKSHNQQIVFKHAISSIVPSIEGKVV